MECEHEEPSAEKWCQLCRHPYYYASINAIVCCGDLLDANRCPKEEAKRPEAARKLISIALFNMVTPAGMEKARWCLRQAHGELTLAKEGK